MASYENDTQNAGFTEYITKVKPNANRLLARILIILGATVALFVMFYLTFKTIPVVSFMAAVAIIFVAWFLLQFTKVEYEYTVATGHVNVSKIYGARKRKEVLSFDTADVIRITRHIPKGKYKAETIVACDDKDPNAYRILYNSGTEEKAVVLSLPEKSQKCFKYYNRNVFAD